jgi:hypothetical protein
MSTNRAARVRAEYDRDIEHHTAFSTRYGCEQGITPELHRPSGIRRRIDTRDSQRYR